MDPLTAISLVGTVVQLVEFGSTLLSTAAQIYHDGALTEHTDMETATKCLLELNNRLKDAVGTAGLDPGLEKLCKACHEVGNELLTVLSKVQVHGNRGKWKSMRVALQSVSSKGKIENLEKRLTFFRAELNLRIIGDLREQVDLVSLRQSGRFKELNERSKEILDAMIDNQNIFKLLIESQTAEIQQMHEDTNERVVELHESTRSQIIQSLENTSRKSMDEHEATRQDLQLHTYTLGRLHAETNLTVLEQQEETRNHLQIMDQRSQNEHETTQREISQLKQALRQLREEMKKIDAGLKESLAAFNRQRSPRKRRRLQKLSNAASATLLALETLYRSIQAVLASLQARARAMWGGPLSSQYSGRVETYQAQVVSTMVTSTTIPSNTLPAPPQRAPIQSPVEAMQLYYHYFYHHLSKHDDLVNVSRMENLWGRHDLLDFSNITSHIECFSVYSAECPIPAVWLMAAVITAIQECISPALDTYAIIVDVFEKSRQSQMREGTYTEGSRAARLRGDFDFWKRFAESRRLDQAIAAYLRRNKLIANGKSAISPTEADSAAMDWEEMVSFLLWLIGNKEKPKNDIRPTFSAQSARVLAVASSLQWVGIHLATELAPRADLVPVTYRSWPLVCYVGPKSVAAVHQTLVNTNNVSGIAMDFV